MKKRIVIITNGTLPVPAILGGAAENLTQTLIDYNEIHNDFEFVVFTVGKEVINNQLLSNYKQTKFICIDERNIIYKIKKIVRYFLNRVFNNSFPNQFLSAVLRNEPLLQTTDLILISNNPLYINHLRKKDIKAIPIVLHLHNDYINKNKAKKKIEILSYVNKVIGVSKFIKESVLEVAPKGCKISYVYNGIDIERFTKENFESQNEIKKRYNIREEDVVFVFSGRLQESKGVHFLVESFLELSKTYENIKLLIIGSSVFSNSKLNDFTFSLQKLIESKKANDIVFFTGFIDNNEIQNYYKSSDIAVLPSIEAEAFGLTSIEAQASGLPVIISDSGGMPETINSKSGFIIKRDKDVKDQLIYFMKQFLDDKGMINKMSIEAVNNAVNYSNLKYYNKMKSELNSI